MRKPIFAEYPYQLHTDNELGFMLRGTKPLAMFSEVVGYWHPLVLRYLRRFDRYVEMGRFHREEFFVDPKPHFPHPSHYIAYTLPCEEWRVAELAELCRSQTWSVEQERRLGELLGYEDWMNDFHIERLLKRAEA